MAKIVSTTVIVQGQSSIKIDEDNYAIGGGFSVCLDEPIEDIFKVLDDQIHIIEVLKKHIQDAH